MSGAATSGASSVAAVVVDGANTLDSTHPLFPDAASSTCAYPESVAATRALAPAYALPIILAEEDGPSRTIAGEVIVTSWPMTMVGDWSSGESKGPSRLVSGEAKEGAPLGAGL